MTRPPGSDPSSPPDAPTSGLGSTAPTQRYGVLPAEARGAREDLPDPERRDEEPLVFRGAPTERYGTVPGPEIVVDEPSTEGPLASTVAAGHHVAGTARVLRAIAGVPLIEDPSRERGLFRRIRDSEVGRAIKAARRARYDPTQRLRKVEPSTSRMLLLAGAVAMALAVLAIGMIVRRWSSIAGEPAADERAIREASAASE